MERPRSSLKYLSGRSHDVTVRRRRRSNPHRLPAVPAAVASPVQRSSAAFSTHSELEAVRTLRSSALHSLEESSGAVVGAARDRLAFVHSSQQQKLRRNRQHVYGTSAASGVEDVAMAAVGADGGASSVHVMLNDWLERYSVEEKTFASPLMFVESKLQELFELTKDLTVPNPFRTWVCCDLFVKLVNTFPDTKTRRVLTNVAEWLLSAIYTDVKNPAGFGMVSYAVRAEELESQLQKLEHQHTSTLHRLMEVTQRWNSLQSKWHPALERTIFQWALPIQALFFTFWKNWTRQRRQRRKTQHVGAERRVLLSWEDRLATVRKRASVRTVAAAAFHAWRQFALAGTLHRLEAERARALERDQSLQVEARQERQRKLAAHEQLQAIEEDVKEAKQVEKRLKAEIAATEDSLSRLQASREQSEAVVESFMQMFNLLRDGLCDAARWALAHNYQDVAPLKGALETQEPLHKFWLRYQAELQMRHQVKGKETKRDTRSQRHSSTSFGKTPPNLHDAGLLPHLVRRSFPANECNPLLKDTASATLALLTRASAPFMLDVLPIIEEHQRQQMNSSNGADSDLDELIYEGVTLWLARLLPSLSMDCDDVLLLQEELCAVETDRPEHFTQLERRLDTAQALAEALQKLRTRGAASEARWLAALDVREKRLWSAALDRLGVDGGIVWNRFAPTQTKRYTRVRHVLQGALKELHPDEENEGELKDCEVLLGRWFVELKRAFKSAAGEATDIEVWTLGDEAGAAARRYSRSEILMTNFQFWRLVKAADIPCSLCTPAFISGIFDDKISSKREIWQHVMSRGSSSAKKRSRKHSIATAFEKVTRLSFIDFVELLVRMAVVKFPDVSLSNRVAQLLKLHVLAARLSKTATGENSFRRQLASSQAEAVFERHQAWLHSVFGAFAEARSEAPSFGEDASFVKCMEIPHFEAFVKCAGMVPTIVPFRVVEHVFGQVQMDSKQEGGKGIYGGEAKMVFWEFLEAIAALACYYQKNPYLPLDVKIDVFITEHLKKSREVEEKRHRFEVDQRSKHNRQSPSPAFS